ncbi:glycodelin-like isoform X1 [Theropithecus gelada]|uniref:glycodelin-like isoform X1 n=1 Tax=Theropithecus gelada TaxID=9565 RepID=UPI000DC16A8F|nr:glycodelin-like isoform X1 [Theropithecus gelada]
MPCLLLTLGVALVCSVQATDIPQTKQNLELPKLAGTWHSMAMATNNISLTVTVKSALRVHVISLWPTPEDHLEIVLHRWENNSCVEKKVLGEKTENPKKFKINCEHPQAPSAGSVPAGWPRSPRGGWGRREWGLACANSLCFRESECLLQSTRY